MITLDNISKFNFESVPIDDFWNLGNERELKIHRIHSYPAKFPSFITTKALEYARKNNLDVRRIADMFCGCGTTAFEAKRNNIDFWGCDLNPVATLIAKVKSKKYQAGRLNRYYKSILNYYYTHPTNNLYESANERLKYWFKNEQYNELYCLKKAIHLSTPEKSDYRLFFLCAFSNILKQTSVWLTKSIKPQVDPNKEIISVIKAFQDQYIKMYVANKEVEYLGKSESLIKTGNILDNKMKAPKADIVVTSPPYVTSYEYADLHQLSTLWLDFTKDYKSLREGTIGSIYHDYNFNREWKRLNNTGLKIVSLLLERYKAKARSVAKYFLDMQYVSDKTYEITSDKGMAVFIIGNTEYKGVRIDNAKHLAEALLNSGFETVYATKRKISNKILTPYRDTKGKFTSDASGRKVYNEEFILIGRK